MKIVIPMSGIGSRFASAGYAEIKPLIKVDGKTIIEHVIDMFPKDSEFIFICNEEHLKLIPELSAVLSINPSSQIVSVKPHKKGPVYAVSQHLNLIDDQEEIIVNYCDFCCDWNFDDFISFVRKNNLDGCIPSYRGFHPHTLWSNYYAYLKLNELLVEDIQEKTPFTNKPRDEYASSGTYYFKSGALLKDSIKKCINQNLHINNEYYISLAYKPLLDDGKKIMPYPLKHFMQWGTPQDLEEYKYHSKSFKILKQFQHPSETMPGYNIIPMAGLGSRFSSQGYIDPKPLIKVRNEYMFLHALKMLPPHENTLLISRNLDLNQNILNNLSEKKVNHIKLDQVTDGQATTCMQAVNKLDHGTPFTIGACDNGLLYNYERFQEAYKSADIIVWSIRDYPGALRRPEMYGWLDVDVNNVIKKVSVKQSIDSNTHLPIVTGAFTIKEKNQYIEAYQKLLERDGKVNGEFYVDELINDCISLGMKCISFEVDSYLCWGTPEDLKTFLYWDECFQSWPKSSE